MRANDDVELAPLGPKGRPQVRRERADRLISTLILEAKGIKDDPLPR